MRTQHASFECCTIRARALLAFSQLNISKRVFRYALGVLDKSTGEMVVQPIAGQKLLRMEPRAHSLNYFSTSTSPTKETTREERRERNARLVEEFGSQRRKRQLAASRAAQVDAKQVTAGHNILGMIASAGAASRDEIIQQALSHRNIPPHNLEGKTADDAYRWNDIIPSSVRDALEIRKLFPAENKPEYRAELERSGDFGHRYVISRLGVLNTEDKQLRETRAQALCLLGHLLRLYVDRRGNVLRVQDNETVQNLAQRLRMATSVCEGILDIFYSREDDGNGGCRYILSKERRHLMLGWILVLAVRVESQSVLEPAALQALVEELKSKPQDLVAFYRELGCSVVRISKGKGVGWRVALLPASAEEKTLGASFPELKVGGRKSTR